MLFLNHGWGWNRASAFFAHMYSVLPFSVIAKRMDEKGRNGLGCGKDGVKRGNAGQAVHLRGGMAVSVAFRQVGRSRIECKPFVGPSC
jgi:hypothetical protein